MAEGDGHMRACGIGPHGPLGDLAREGDHLLPERGEDEGRQRPRLLGAGLKLAHEAAHVFERPARRYLEPGQGRPVAHPDPEAEAAARELVDEGGGMGVVVGMPGVHVGDGRPEGDLVGGEGDGFAESEAVAEARAVDSGEAFLLEALGELDGGLASARGRGEADRGLAGQAHGSAPPHRFHEVVSVIGLRRLGPYFTAG